MSKKKAKVPKQKVQKVEGTHPVNFRMNKKYHALLLEELGPQDRSVAWLMNKLVEKHLTEGKRI